MHQLKIFKYHYFSYRLFFLLSTFVFLILSAIFIMFRLNQYTIIYSLIILLLLETSLLAIYESTFNLKIFLNINLNRQAYLISDGLGLIFYSTINTLLLYILITICHSINLLNIQHSVSFYLLIFTTQLIINRIFYFIGFYLYKFAYIIAIGLIWFFVFLNNSLKLIDFLISNNQVNKIHFIWISIFVILELLLIKKIKKLNLIFKKSLSVR